MNREQRRAEASVTVDCPACGQSIKTANLSDHYAGSHPGQTPPDVSDQLAERTEERDESRADVGSFERGTATEGAQSPEQAPIPNPTDRRPSTQDKTVGY